jgi:rhodanese-related sulfurtransferase
MKSLNIMGAPAIVVSFMALAGVVTFLDINMPEEKIASVSASEFIEELKSKEDIVILDVRTPEEFRQGHVVGAINIDYNSPTFDEDLSSLNMKSSYAIYCRSGNRSAEALSVMEQKGFIWVIDLVGGIEALAQNKKAREYFK